MQFLTLLATTSLAAAAALPNSLDTRGNPPSEGGGFVPHCYTYEVGERGEIVGRLIGQCGDDELFKNLHDMWLDLNLCLGNYNGTLTWQDKGNAIATSCKDCKSRQFNTRWIDCSCRDTLGGWKSTSLDLNEGVRYDPGHHVLACFGNLGVLDDPKV